MMKSRRQVQRVVRHERPVGVRAGDQVQILLVAEHAGRLEYLGFRSVADPLGARHRSGVELEDARSPPRIVPVLVSADAVEDAVEVSGPPHLSRGQWHFRGLQRIMFRLHLFSSQSCSY